MMMIENAEFWNSVCVVWIVVALSTLVGLVHDYLEACRRRTMVCSVVLGVVVFLLH